MAWIERDITEDTDGLNVDGTDWNNISTVSLVSIEARVSPLITELAAENEHEGWGERSSIVVTVHSETDVSKRISGF